MPCTYYLCFFRFPDLETEPMRTASSSAHRLCGAGKAERNVLLPSSSSPPEGFKPPSDVKATSRLLSIAIWHCQLNFPAWSIEGSNAYCIAVKSGNPEDLYKAFSPGCGYLEFMPPTPCQFPVHSLPCRTGLKHAVAKSSSNLTNLW